MTEWLARSAYSLLLRLATPVYLARLWWRGRHEPLYRSHWVERLGGVMPPAQGRLWLHAVSLGETRAAAALIDALRRQRPGLRLLLTHGTATGRAAGAALLAPGDAQAWLPYDTPGAVRRFLRHHRPVLGVVMETEVWPNLLHAAQVAGVPMVLANARLSERSRLKGERLAALLHPALAASPPCWRRPRPTRNACALRAAAGAGDGQPEVRCVAAPELLRGAMPGGASWAARWCWPPSRAKARKSRCCASGAPAGPAAFAAAGAAPSAAL
jgi:hypothetical protein